jgi:hypothetical protein
MRRHMTLMQVLIRRDAAGAGFMAAGAVFNFLLVLL